MSDLRYYLGVDAGGTKTHALIADQTGRIHGAGRAGTGNWESVGLDGAARSLAHALDGALSSAGLRKADLRGAGYGLAGMDWPSDEPRLLPVLQNLELPGSHVLVNDAYVALRAGSDAGYGIAVISGTGVTIAGHNRAGEHFRTFALGGDWGDFGSSSDVVALATRAIGYAYTGRGPATQLTERLLEHYQVRDTRDLVERITRGQAAPPNGKLAPVVFATAAAGDEVARAVLIEVGQELGRNAVAIARKLQMLDQSFDLVLAGGTFRDPYPLFRDALIELVRASAPHVQPMPLLSAPAIGAALLAMDAAGEAVGAQVRQRLIGEARQWPDLLA
jgi:N-acetylglucosamine kinase-like BadF-type ATPase